MKERIKRFWWKLWPCHECGAFFFEECHPMPGVYIPKHSRLI